MLTTLAATAREFEELRRIASEISWYEEEARKSIALALQYKLEVGRRLKRAKDMLPHGKFLSWAHQEFGWTPRHVQNHLLLAANAKQVSRLAPGASLRMALAAIKGAQLKVSNGPNVALGALEPPSVQIVHIIGEVKEGMLNREQLLVEVARIASSLGAPKTKWRIR